MPACFLGIPQWITKGFKFEKVDGITLGQIDIAPAAELHNRCKR